MLDIIREADLFEGVSQRVLAEIANEGEEVTFEEGAIIYSEGEVSAHIYELMEGGIDLVMMEKHTVHLTVTRSGQIFGWSALIKPYTHMATAKCTAPTKAVRMSRDSIERIIENHPHEGLTMLKNLSSIIAHRLRDAYAFIHYCMKLDGG